MARVRLRRFFATILLFSLVGVQNAYAQLLPAQFTIEGRLFDTSVTPAVPQNTQVNIQLELIDSGNPTCVLYRETHTGVDVSNADTNLQGRFSLALGSVVTPDYIAPEASGSLTKLFGAGTFTGEGSCSATVNNSGNREVRVSVDPVGAPATFTQLSPNVIITASPVALTLQGLPASSFLQAKDDAATDLNQTNLETIFSATNFDKLSKFLAGTATAPYSFNNQRVTNVGTPAAATDAVNRNYADANVGGKTAVTTGVGLGVGNGYTLIWDAGTGQWTTGVPSANDSTKLPLAGGTMAGNITMAGYDLYNTGHVTMGNQRLLQLGTFTSAQESALTLAAGDAGKILFNTTNGSVRMWNGSAFSGFTPGGAAGGDLTGNYPSPTIANSAVTTAKIADGSITTVKIGDGQVTSVKIADLDPTKLQQRGAIPTQVLMWNGSAWWPTSDPGDIWSVTAGTGLTGGGAQYDVTLSLANTAVTIGSYGSASQVATFTVDQQGRLTAAGNTAISLPTTALQSTGASANQVLTWNGSAWVPSAVPTAGISALVGDVSASGTGSVTATIANNVVRTFHLTNTTPAVNRLLITDGTTGNSVALADACNVGEVLKWQGVVSGWACAADNTGGSAVTAVTAGNGLNGGVITSVGTISVNSGTGPNQIVQLDGTSKLPAVDGSALTNVSATKLQGRTLASTNPTSGYVLGWNGAQWEPTAAAGGVGQVTAGTGLSGGGAATNVTLHLADTAVTVGTYGSASHSAVFTVDQQGRLTAAGSAGISIPVSALKQSGATTNQILQWNGSAWVATTASFGTGSVTYVGTTSDLTGGGFSGAGTLGINTGTGSNQILKLNGASQIPAVDGSLLTGVNASKIAGQPVASTAPGSPSQVLKWNGSAWEPNHVNYNDLINAAGIYFTYRPNATACSTNEVLKWNGSAWTCGTDNGNIGNVVAGTGLTGGGTSATITLALATTAVTANSYGSSSQVATFTVDTYGRLTAAGSANISIPVTAINTTGAANQILAWNGSAWWPTTPSYGSGTLTYVGTTSDLTGGPISGAGTLGINTGTGPNQIVKLNGASQIPAVDGSLLTNINAVKLQGVPIANVAPTSGYVLQYNGSGWVPTAASAGDITDVQTGTGLTGGFSSGAGTISLNNTSVTVGSYGSTKAVATFTVDQQGRLTAAGSANIAIPINAINTTGSANQILAWNGSAWWPTTPSYGSGSVTYIGTNSDLSGGPITGAGTLSVVTGTGSNQILRLNGSSQIPAVDGSLVTKVTAEKIQGVQVATTAPSAGYLLQYNGSGWVPTAPSYGSVAFVTTTSDLTGGPITTTGTIGINTGTGPNQIVKLNGSSQIPAVDGTLLTNINAVKLQGVQIANIAPTSGYFLQYNGSGWVPTAANGDITDVQTGTGLIGGFNSGSGTISLNNTSVSTGSYGSSTSVATFTVDQQGRLTAAGSANIAIPVTALLQTGATANQILQWNGSAWVPSAVGGGTLTFITTTSDLTGGPITGAGTIGINAGTGPNQIVKLNASSQIPAVDGSLLTSVNAVKLQGVQIANIAPTSGYVLQYNGTGWVPTAAGGDFKSDGSVAMTGTIRAPAGSIGGPGFTFSGDTDVGMWRPAANVMAFSSGGTERVRIDNLGRVGISTNGPLAQLHLFGTSATTDVTARFENTAGGGLAYNEFYNDTGLAGIIGAGGSIASDLAEADRLFLESNTSGISLYASGAGDIKFYTGTSSAPKMTMDNSGNIGLGGSPATNAIMTFTGTGAASSIIVPRDSTALRPATGVNGMIRYNTTSQKFEVYEGRWQNMLGSAAGGGGDFMANGSVPMTGTVRAVAGSVTGPAYTFSADTDTGVWQSAAGILNLSTNGTERLRVAANGSVGVGTNNPSTRLHVQDGGISLLNETTNGGLTLRSAGSTVYPFAAFTASRGTLAAPTYPLNGDPIGVIAFNNQTGQNANISVTATQNQSGTGFGASMSFYTTDNNTVSSQERLRIEPNGRIVIGTTAAGTTGALLDLAGTGSAFSSLIVPRDTAANRPTGVNGMIRFNTTSQKFEVFENGWQNMLVSGGGDFMANGSVPMTGSVRLPNGSTTGPAMTFNADTDTGLWTSSAGILNFSTNGTERIRIDNLGAIGIGTGFPATQLHLYGNVNTLLGPTFENASAGGTARTEVTIKEGTSTLGIGLGSAPYNNSEAYIWNYTNSAISFATNNAERMRITASGAIAIGTTTPTPGTILDLNGVGTGGSAFIVPRDTTALRPGTGVNGMIRYNTNTSKFEGFQAGQWVNLVATGAGSIAGPITISPTGTSSVPAYSFNAEGDTGMYLTSANTGVGLTVNGTERLRVDSAGNVLANSVTGAPVYNSGTNRNFLSMRSPTSAAVLELATAQPDAASAFIGQIQFVDSNISPADKRTALISAQTPATGTVNNRGGIMTFHTRTDTVGLSERMRIDDTGNVGIALTGPAEKLDVGGNIRATGQIYATSFYTATSTSSIDLNNGNMQILDTPGAASLTLTNLKDGGSYMIILKSTGAITYNFSGCTTRWNPASPVTSTGNYYMYNIVYTVALGGTCFISWSGPY